MDSEAEGFKADDYPALPGKLNSICPAVANDTALHSSSSTLQNTVNFNNISIYYQNVRGLRTKIDELFNSVSDAELDVVILTETWLNDQILSPQLFGNGYTVYRNDRDPVCTGKKRGGGVLIGISNRLSSSASLVEVNKHIEQLWVNINGGYRTICNGVVYLPPDVSTSATSIEQHIQSVLDVSEKLHPHDYHLVFGDYNQPIYYTYEIEFPHLQVILPLYHLNRFR